MVALLGLLMLVARLLVCATLAVAAAEHLRRHRRTPAGWGRVAAAVPVVAALHLAPLLFNPVTEPWAVVLCLNFPWLSGSAVLTWAMGRGPLAQELPHFRAFLTFLAVPALPAPSAPPPATSHSRPPRAHTFSLLRLTAKPALLAGAAYVLQCLSIPHWVLGPLQAVTLYLFTSLCLEVASLAASLLSGMPVLPQFNKPWLASSLSELWSCRWNLVGGSRFRQLVYEPACHGLFVAEQPQPAANGGTGTGSTDAAAAGPPAGRRASRQRRAVAMCATFAMSGAMHELCFWYLTRRLSGHWFLFFSIQGPLLLLEALLGEARRAAGLHLPRPLRIATTVGVLHILAQWLFFPDVVAAGIPHRLLLQLWPGASTCRAAAVTATSHQALALYVSV